MSEREAETCHVEDGKLTPCAGLERLMEGRANAKNKGVTMMVLMNLQTGETTRTGAVLRSGEHRDRGILMNYCPMCGEHITPHFTAGGEAL